MPTGHIETGRIDTATVKGLSEIPESIPDVETPEEQLSQRATRAEALSKTPMSKKPMLLLGAGVVGAVSLLMLTTLVGKPSSPKTASVPPKASQSKESGTQSKGSSTPLMDPVHPQTSNNGGGELTPADINRTKANHALSSSQDPVQGTVAHMGPTGTILRDVPSFSATQQHWEEPKPYDDPSTASPSSTQQPSQANVLKEASLVFVQKSVDAPKTNSSSLDPKLGEPNLEVTPGTRIQARLETQATTAIAAPVVAIVEYTYSLGDHVVIPAGARLFGQMQQADKSGAVGIKFSEIQFLDGNTERVEAIGAGLDLGPIKGAVAGKNTGRNFLVRTASGIGSIAAMVVGNNTSSAFSEDDLIRQRISQNVGNAGDSQLMSMAVTNKIVVSVPANTPIYVVFTKRQDPIASSKESPGS